MSCQKVDCFSDIVGSDLQGTTIKLIERNEKCDRLNFDFYMLIMARKPFYTQHGVQEMPVVDSLTICIVSNFHFNMTHVHAREC